VAEKTKLQKHMEELGEETSGGSHDAITASGRGLSFLERLFKSANKKDEYEDDMDDNDDDDEDEDDEEDVPAKKVKKSEGKSSKKVNQETLEDEDEDDLEDPGDGEEEIIANKGERVKGAAALGKSRAFDERRFQKSMEEYEDVMDATPALENLAKSVRLLGKSSNATQEQIGQVIEQNVLLGKAVRELLKSNAALASDVELIKSQPGTSPSNGFVVFNKNESGAAGVSKYDIQDALTDAMNDGHDEAPDLLKNLSRVNDARALKKFVSELPEDIKNRL